MTSRNSLIFSTLAILLAVASSGCERKLGPLQPVPPITDRAVFIDNFGEGVDFQAFLGSKLDAVSIDTNERYLGSASLKVTIPGPGDPTGGYAGGAFTTRLARDLSANDALTFWAKASMAANLDVAGLGNDNTGTSLFEASWSSIALTTAWTKYVIPIPLPDRLTSERGLFFFAEGPESGQGYTVWFDDVSFEKVGTIFNPRPSMNTQTIGAFVGATVSVAGTKTIFAVAGVDQTIEHQPGYFTYESSNDTVATVSNGEIRAVGPGQATISAKLGSVAASGVVTINSSAPPPSAAPTPTVPPANVISLFSNAYANVPVTTWSAPWDQADLSDFQIQGNATKAYTNLAFAGIEFVSPTIDVTTMTHFHMDVWLPAGTVFRIKLVDFGANGVFGGGDDREYELFFNAATNPPLVTGAWFQLEIPMSRFLGLTTRAHLAQLVLSGDPGTVFVDNIYFHN